MKRIICSLLVAVIAGIGLGSVFCGTAIAESAEEFYQNKTVTLNVTYGPGGGTDAAARIIAANWKAVTGGTMVVKNLEGAGGLVGMNQVYTMKPDGLNIGYTDSASSLLGPVIFKNPGVRFDAAKLVYLGTNLIQPYAVAIGKASSANSLEDMRKISGLKFGTLARDGHAATCALTIELFELKDARIVAGYAGMEELGLALARGEVDVVPPQLLFSVVLFSFSFL